MRGSGDLLTDVEQFRVLVAGRGRVTRLPGCAAARFETERSQSNGAFDSGLRREYFN